MRQGVMSGAGTRPAGLASRIVLGFAILVLAAMATAAQAQPIPDPASIAAQQNQQRAEELARQTTPTQRGEAIITDPIVRADLPPPGGPTILLRKVVFQPASEFITPQELAAIAAAYEGRTLDFSQIASLVRDVNDIYAERGVVTASAVLPPQTLENGVLVVQLVEGQLGAVSLLGERRSSDDFLLDRVTLTRGSNVVDVPAAARDLAWFNRTHSAQMRMLLEPGSSFGLTDLSLGISEPPAQVLQFSLDNEGTTSTGELQWSVSYRAYGLAGIDDNFMMVLSGSQGSLAATVTADMPIHPSGTRISFGGTTSQIEVINGPVGQLGVIGGSRMATASISQPIIADTNWLLSAVASASYGQSDSQLSGMTLVDNDTRRGSVGFVLSYNDETTEFFVQPQIVAATVYDNVLDTSRDIQLFTGATSASFFIADGMRLVTRGAWQYTDAQLLPGNLLFQVGGPGTVRGYPSNGVGGDSGYYLQAELHTSLAEAVEGLSGFVFSDFGEVFSTFPQRTTLHSVGAGLRYNWNDHVNLDVTVGVPLRQSMPDQSGFEIYSRVTGRVF